MSTAETYVCREDEIGVGEVRRVGLAVDEDGRPFQALVLRDETGKLVAYRNLCRHLPVPLDGGVGELLTEGGEYLVCRTHGAIYRPRDGMCVGGPCEGLALERLRVRVDAGAVYIARGVC